MTPRLWKRRRADGDGLTPDRDNFATTLTEGERSIIAEVRPYTMVSDERLVCNMDAVRHVVDRDISGAIVECGVWRGGSVLAMIRVLQQMGVHRDVYLFDTFEGMTEPTAHDTSRFDRPASEEWEESVDEGRRPWDTVFGREVFDLESVRAVMTASGYPTELLHLVPGRVEETIPESAPERIAVLRLDTDWYESTRHELEHLYPRLSDGGALILDDYGHWEGARRAVDEYFSGSASRPMLARIDYTGRIGIKH